MPVGICGSTTTVAFSVIVEVGLRRRRGRLGRRASRVKLLLQHPTMVVGPFSPTIEAVINEFKPNNVADFMVGGLTQLDTMNYPYVFRVSSDSNEAIAMAYYAIKHGWKWSAWPDLRQLGELAGLRAAAREGVQGTRRNNRRRTSRSHPGHPVLNAELAQAFSKSPQVISGLDGLTVGRHARCSRTVSSSAT